MRIAVVHTLRRGGAARRLSGTMLGLAERADVELGEFSLSSSVGMFELAGLVPAPGTRVRAGVHTYAGRLPRSLRPPVRYLDDRLIIGAWQRLVEQVNSWQPDAVFANSCSLLHAAPPTLPRLAAPSLLYLDEPRRADYDEDARATTNPATRWLYEPARRARRRADRAAVRSATALATNSAITAAAIAAAYGRDAAVVAPGVADIFAPSCVSRTPARWRARHVVSVGSMIASKGHDLAISALGRSGVGLPLVIVAPHDNPAEHARLISIAVGARVPVEVRIGVSDAVLAQLYRDALVTMYLARAEPLGLVSLESQACGTPAIVSDEGGLLHTVEHGVTGFRVPREQAAAATALRSIAQPVVRAAMGRAAAARPVPRNGSSAERTLDLLDELARPFADTQGLQ
jgi:glycosyltransferase involved in cell wall biosynthesis